MTEETKPKKASKTGLELLREPFPANQIGKLPKPTKKQTDEVKANSQKGMRCKVCKQWHHPDVIHLDYVGHAPLTDRMLDVDPNWNWEPMAKTDQGLPVFDNSGGLWIRLTICGLTRIGYGNAKAGGDAGNREKEVIGDALRNAGMRFGMALDLWHKGELHVDEDAPPSKKTKQETSAEPPDVKTVITKLNNLKTTEGYASLVSGFGVKYGTDIWGQKCGDGDKTWRQLFEETSDRLIKEKTIQLDFRHKVEQCTTIALFKELETFIEDNPALHQKENFDTMAELRQRFLGESDSKEEK